MVGTTSSRTSGGRGCSIAASLLVRSSWRSRRLDEPCESCCRTFPERVAGIGPALESWEDPLLPLQHTRRSALAPFYADSRIHFDQRPCSAVRRRWQFAHRTSHFAISASRLLQFARFTIVPTASIFVVPSR